MFQYDSLFENWESGERIDITFSPTLTRSAQECCLEPLEPQLSDQKSSPRHRFSLRKLLEVNSRFQPLPSSTYSTPEDFSHGTPGWWKKQMLVDRSLRSMAAFVLLCAAIMLVIILCYMKEFLGLVRFNKSTSTVGGKEVGACKSLKGQSSFVHLLINIAATLILSCSNTYQQLVTSLEVNEVKWVLEKRGDSRVGTNSPWNINHKRTGRTRAWLCWLLLIGTSFPIHFLANSMTGLSLVIQTPSFVDYATENPEIFSENDAINLNSDDGILASNLYEPYDDDFGCWSAFRTGSYVMPHNVTQYHLSTVETFDRVAVIYDPSCTRFLNNTSIAQALSEFREPSNTPPYVSDYHYSNDTCIMGINVACLLHAPQPNQCRMSVRMHAAFILGGCLLIKAIYMITVNIRARYQTKTQVLTFGDVVVASVLDSSLKVHNECLISSGDVYRQQVKHTCHKHCKAPTQSTHGNELGHCQKCKKWNLVNKAADLPHPIAAIKYKRSLLANLGDTVVIQMVILVVWTLAMVAMSIMVLTFMASYTQSFHYNCGKNPDNTDYSCDKGLAWNLEQGWGSWGGISGSVSLGPLPPDSLGSELAAMGVSNGVQFLYSLLYLLLVYNITLISMEKEWGEWEKKRKKPRATLVRGDMFEQSYFLQLPFKIMGPLMCYSALMHWLLGQAMSATETVYSDRLHGVEHSVYQITFAVYPLFGSTILMCGMTGACWWAFTYKREGFIPQMYGSVRTLCASTTELTDFNPKGIIWGDLGMGEKFRHAGFSSEEPGEIVPAELYCGRD